MVWEDERAKQGTNKKEKHPKENIPLVHRLSFQIWKQQLTD